MSVTQEVRSVSSADVTRTYRWFAGGFARLQSMDFCREGWWEMGPCGAKGEVLDMGGLVHSAVRWSATPVGPARCTGLGDAVRNGLPAPKGAGLLTSHGEAGAFKDGRPRGGAAGPRSWCCPDRRSRRPLAAHGVLCPDRGRGLF
ncbi:hypothetical protein AHiyo1_44800 [Arthrobacter sp. Hiyo1]|nr:hypothetical protein AHiyo1_44800 [Arthrobacter sp. Hiyo1]